MGDLKYRFVGNFEDLEFAGAKPVENDKKQRIQLAFATAIRTGQGDKAKNIRADLARELDIFWRAKVSPELWRKLKSLGLKDGAKCSIRAAVDNWSTKEGGAGLYFEILELLECEPPTPGYDFAQAAGEGGQ